MKCKIEFKNKEKTFIIKDVIIIVLLCLLPFLLSCESKKPEYISFEDYSYLKRQNKVLFLLKLSVDKAYDSALDDLGQKVNEALEKHNFNKSYRKSFIAALNKEQEGISKRLIVDVGIVGEDISKENIRYFGVKRYPKGISSGYDLVMEVEVASLLFFEGGLLHFIQRASVGLRDAKVSRYYLSLADKFTNKSVAKLTVLSRDKRKLITLVEKLMITNVEKINKYLLNKLSNPKKSDITPLLLELQK